MNYIFKKEIINYDFTNINADKTVLFLHGWGGNKHSFLQTMNLLRPNCNIFTLTLPTISPTTEPWTLFDYVTLVKNLLGIHKIHKITIVCHSFGFRIASILKNYIKVEKIVITGGAGIIKNSIFKKIERTNNALLLKQKKFKYLYSNLASTDYKTLSKINKTTFKNIVNQNLKFNTKFNCPVLLFWGKFDKETPLWIGKRLQKQNRAKLLVTNSDHFAYLKENNLFNFEVKNFLK